VLEHAAYRDAHEKERGVNHYWLWGGILASATVPAVAFLLLFVYLRVRFLDIFVRIFQERPLFITPRGHTIATGEEVWFPTADGLTLHGWYLPTTSPPRRGVIVFGLEFGSACEACLPYCQHLIANGFDVFTFEPRNQGRSEAMPGYDPMQWVTEFEVADFRAAVAYLRSRPDAPPHGIGLYGISRGASAGLLAAAKDRYLCCFVTDGAFATLTTMVPFMRKWVGIYSNRKWLQNMPEWIYKVFAQAAFRRIEKLRRCRLSHLEHAIPQLTPRRLLMIHGGADKYITPDMAQRLFRLASEPKSFWLVKGAKHNQALQVAGEEYQERVLAFFGAYLAAPGFPWREECPREARPVPS
jgi:fermentation-respiration switch protein FrsA (DUF1100 family)